MQTKAVCTGSHKTVLFLVIATYHYTVAKKNAILHRSEQDEGRQKGFG